MTAEPTDTAQSMASSASAADRTAARIISQVPSTAHLISRLWAVWNGPSAAGRSRQGELVRYFQAIALKSATMVGPPPATNRIGRHQRLDPVPHRISDHSSDRHSRSTDLPTKETRARPLRTPRRSAVADRVLPTLRPTVPRCPRTCRRTRADDRRGAGRCHSRREAAAIRVSSGSSELDLPNHPAFRIELAVEPDSLLATAMSDGPCMALGPRCVMGRGAMRAW